MCGPLLLTRNANCWSAFPSADLLKDHRSIDRIDPIPFHLGGMCFQEPTVPIRPFLEHDHSFGPEDIANMSAAFLGSRPMKVIGTTGALTDCR
jgi:hypothetical protein